MTEPSVKVAGRTAGALTLRPRIGLALGGGGARGLAHVAALEVLDELEIRPNAIAGTSIGAIFGAAYASGLSAAQIRALTQETLSGRFSMIRQLLGARTAPVGRMFRVLPRRSALLDPSAIIDVVLPARMPRRFEELEIPLKLTATDLGTQQAIVLDSGDLKSAVAASIAIPVLFAPVDRDETILLDGGLSNPCPFDLLDGLCDLTVAIDVSGAASDRAFEQAPTVMETMVHATQILQKSITRERLRYAQPDVYIDVNLDQFGALEFYKPKEILAAAEPIKDELRLKLKRLLEAETLVSPIG